MNDLSEIRQKIDHVDGELLRLLNERAVLAREIGAIKNREGLPVYAPEREDQLLRGLVERNHGPLTGDAIRAIYREIMSASLSLEKDVAIACLGPAGGAAHQAARSKFGSSVKYVFFSEVDDVFRAVGRDEADCGVVPLEDPERGVVNHTLDELVETELSICAEIVTAEASSESAGSSSRCLVLARAANSPSGNDQTALVLRIEDKAGALVSALEPFKTLNINLSHFASRPASKGSKDVFFFVEAEGHIRDLQVADLFRELSKRCRAVKVLGSYPRAGTIS